MINGNNNGRVHLIPIQLYRYPLHWLHPVLVVICIFHSADSPVGIPIIRRPSLFLHEYLLLLLQSSFICFLGGFALVHAIPDISRYHYSGN